MSDPAHLPLVDVKRQHASLRAELSAAFERILDSGQFILGEAVESFERDLARYVGTPFGVGVSSGTDALVLALLAAGVGPGTEVITTPFTFFATVGAILKVGAIPRFVDIERDGFNIDPARVAEQITPHTRALICVHLFGAPARALELRELCDREGLVMIEDAAQSIGASIHGRKVGSIGHLGCFSFFPSKPLGALGDGGMITTTDSQLFERCRLLRAHGARQPHEHVILGGNHRLDALQAAFLSVKLPHLDGWQASRARHAAAYDEAFAHHPEICRHELRAGERSAHAHYTLRLLGRATARRDRIVRALRVSGVGAAVYYSRPTYAQPVSGLTCTLSGSEQRSNPQAESRCREVITLPLFPELTEVERGRVISLMLEHLE